MNPFDIALRDVLFAILLPEPGRVRRTDQLVEQRLDLARRLRAALQTEHVAFIHQPIAQVDAAKQQRLACAIDQLFSVLANEMPLRLQRDATHQYKNSQKSTHGSPQDRQRRHLPQPPPLKW